MSTNLRIASDTPKRAISKRSNFTADVLARLTVPTGKRDIHIYDAKTPGLCFRLTAGGAGSFYLYRRIGGRPQRYRLGGRELTIEQARNKAAKLNGSVAEGNDPAAVKRALRESDTLQQTWDRYLREELESRLRQNTLRTHKDRFENHLAELASKKLLTITAADVKKLHNRLGKEAGHVTANRVVQLLRRLFNYARLNYNPARTTQDKQNNSSDDAIELFHEGGRLRYVKPEEMPKLFKELDAPDINPAISDFIKLALFTGARKSNVASMNMADIDLTAKIWTIPAAQSKNDEMMHIVLADPAVKIIKKRWGDESGFIFPSALSASGHIEEVKSTWVNVRERAGLADVTIHDLRRSLGSWLANANASLQIVGKALGHIDPNSTKRYSHLQDGLVRAHVKNVVGAMIKSATKKRRD